MDSRVYVVISDAFRYETAQELTAQMTGKFSGNTECGVHGRTAARGHLRWEWLRSSPIVLWKWTTS